MEATAMATTGLEVFDRTLHTTNLWLDEINAEIGPDRHLAWHVLGAVLRSIRDEMLVEQSAHFAAQLPLLIRGAYFDQYRPATQPAAARSHDDFIARIQHEMDGARPVNVQQAAIAVMRTLNRHITEGQVKKVRDALPKGVRAMWPEPEHKSPAHAGSEQDARPAGAAAQQASASQSAAPQQSAPRTATPPQHAAASQQTAPKSTVPLDRAPLPAHPVHEDIDANEEETVRRGAPIGAAAGRSAHVHASPAAEPSPAAVRKNRTRAKDKDS
jgi:uncharacterized protein (DUF2267 family)